ncbi:UNVERIFIED_CONTAM: hypothetical protein PYX00_010403 [Menopon gallinae]|uniref:Uncharacterized protein n=1 Tax=Menopon gallinae TaxID=328185 RepID=A0AAW2HFC6_9NEOP
MDDKSLDLSRLCRICSADLQDKGVGIFSAECMDNLVGEKIKRYLHFSVSIKDSLPKMVCTTCLKKLENIHRFAKMAAEMQEKFRMLLSSKQEKPKIKIKSLDDINKEALKENGKMDDEEKSKVKSEMDENFEVNIDVAVEEVGENSSEMKIDESSSAKKDGKKPEKETSEPTERRESRKSSVDDEADTSDSDRLVIQDQEEKPNASLLQSLLLKGKQQMTLDMDHDYLMKVKQEPEIKEEPADPEDEDIAEEIAEDRLNQIIKDEMGSETEQESEEEDNSDIEITEMEVKVDPMLYFSNASQSGNEIEQDSQDGQDNSIPDENANSSSNTDGKEDKSNEKNPPAEQPPLMMTRHQQKMNPVIASLKLGKPYKCTVCPRSFITDIGLQNHLWSHLPKSRKSQSSDGHMIHKNVDLEDSQVYSSNGVLHTALPSENPHLLKYVCPICGKKISTKGNLKVHLETHRPKGKYGCDICGRVFKTAANLFRHKDYHGGVQFPCPVCGRVYPTNSTLRAHSITHSDLRPHKCPLCSKTFKRNQDLKFHINQHTGARPYQCPYCPKAFASSGNCFSHRKRMHPLEVERDKERAAEIMG